MRNVIQKTIGCEWRELIPMVKVLNVHTPVGNLAVLVWLMKVLVVLFETINNSPMAGFFPSFFFHSDLIRSCDMTIIRRPHIREYDR